LAPPQGAEIDDPFNADCWWNTLVNRRIRPRSRPALQKSRRVTRAWRYRLAPPTARKRRRRGLPTLWLRVRRLLWSWSVWTAAATYALASDQWGWAAGFAGLALFVHLAAPREQAPQIGLDHDMSVDDPAFQDSVVGLTGTPFVPGNRVTVLENGDAFYPAMLDAVRAARHSITIEAYIYWHGSIGIEFAEALAERSRAGVAVKILLDAVGSATIGRRILETLEAGKCQLAWFNPIRWYALGGINHRTHRKTLLIDGCVAFTGGAGIADHWTGHAQDPEHWRDTQIRLEGPAAIPLQTGFAQNWLETTGELISGPAFFPDVPSRGTVPVQTMLSSPATGASAARILYYLAIVCARKSIQIANPYFVPDQAAIDILVDARKRGVDVTVIVSGIRNDNWLARYNSTRLYGALLQRGISLHEYNRTMLHQKTMVVDGQWATIGTTNFDSRSFALNEESNVSFTDRTLIAELQRTFAADLAVSDRITLTAWQHRGIWSRLQELAASVFQEQA
jgi:cardiolipin synthase A/B